MTAMLQCYTQNQKHTTVNKGSELTNKIRLCLPNIVIPYQLHSLSRENGHVIKWGSPHPLGQRLQIHSNTIIISEANGCNAHMLPLWPRTQVIESGSVPFVPFRGSRSLCALRVFVKDLATKILSSLRLPPQQRLPPFEQLPQPVQLASLMILHS